MLKILYDSILITIFVFSMMLIIEFLNIQTKGNWGKILGRRRNGQYIIGALLGAIPGCLGSFTAVSLYTHNIISIGALITTMIATMGDETFILLALSPQKGLVIILILFLVSLPSGFLFDLLLKEKQKKFFKCNCMEIHEDKFEYFSLRLVLPQLKSINFERFLLMVLNIFSLLLVAFGFIGPEEWNWVRITIIIVIGIATLISVFASDHFLKEHIWEHILKKHIPRLFLWTLGALIFVELIVHRVNIQEWIQSNKYIVLLIASLVGLVPESGPHIIFVTLYIQGNIPFSVLLASSIVQDGHGMLPVLAHSRRVFLGVKLINFAIGLSFGFLLMLLGL